MEVWPGPAHLPPPENFRTFPAGSHTILGFFQPFKYDIPHNTSPDPIFFPENFEVTRSHLPAFPLALSCSLSRPPSGKTGPLKDPPTSGNKLCLALSKHLTSFPPFRELDRDQPALRWDRTWVVCRKQLVIFL